MRQNTNPDDLRQYLCKSCDRTGWIYTNEKGERIEFANGLHDKVAERTIDLHWRANVFMFNKS
jgi:hypothetical protein